MAEQRTNEEVIREGFLAFSEARFEDSLAVLDPEIEWHIAFRLPDLPRDQPVVRGHDAVRDVWKRFTSVWERLVFDPEEFLYQDDDQAVVRIHVHGIGGESGIEVDRILYYLLTLRDRKLLRIQPFDTAGEAAAAGGIELPESPETA